MICWVSSCGSVCSDCLMTVARAGRVDGVQVGGWTAAHYEGHQSPHFRSGELQHQTRAGNIGQTLLTFPENNLSED